MSQNTSYTPASFALPTEQTPDTQKRRRGRPPRQQVPQDINLTQGPPVPVHPAYRPNLVQVDADRLDRLEQQALAQQANNDKIVRLEQQILSHQATITSLITRIDILESVRFGLPLTSTASNPTYTATVAPTPDQRPAAANSNNPSTHAPRGDVLSEDEEEGQAAVIDDQDSDSDEDMTSPIQQLLSEINQHAAAAPYSNSALTTTNMPSTTADIPKDMAYPVEGQLFALEITTDANGKCWVGGGAHGASAVLNAWAAPHGYRIHTRRSKIKSGRYYLTICCTSGERKNGRSIKVPPTREEIEESYEQKPPTDGVGRHDCPFRFVLRQVEKGSKVFEVRLMKTSGLSLPHNHGPDPNAIVERKRAKKLL